MASKYSNILSLSLKTSTTYYYCVTLRCYCCDLLDSFQVNLDPLFPAGSTARSDSLAILIILRIQTCIPCTDYVTTTLIYRHKIGQPVGVVDLLS